MEGLLGMLLDRVERLWPSREPICFGEAPLAGGAPSHFFLGNDPSSGDLETDR